MTLIVNGLCQQTSGWCLQTFECLSALFPAFVAIISLSRGQPEAIAEVNEMPCRLLAVSELAELLRALSYPRRIRIVEELRNGERDVASLAKSTELANSSVS